MRAIPIGLVAVAAGIVAVGCGGGGLPPASVASLSSAQAAVRAASEVGAEQVPRAALYLKYAKDQIRDAEALLEDGEEEHAGRVLTRAEADAEVALALARAAEAEGEVEQAQARLNAMQRASEGEQ